jgi:hypothetical protein
MCEPSASKTRSADTDARHRIAHLSVWLILASWATAVSADDLLLTCKFKDGQDASSPEREVSISVRLSERRATWGGYPEQEATITPNLISIELPPLPVPSTSCSEELFDERTVSIDRMSRQYRMHIFVRNKRGDPPSPDCWNEYRRKNREMPKNALYEGTCEKVEKRAF